MTSAGKYRSRRRIRRHAPTGGAIPDMNKIAVHPMDHAPSELNKVVEKSSDFHDVLEHAHDITRRAVGSMNWKPWSYREPVPIDLKAMARQIQAKHRDTSLPGGKRGGGLSFKDVLQAGVDETVKPYKMAYKDMTYMTDDPSRFTKKEELAKGGLKYWAGHWRVGQARLAGAATMSAATGVGIPIGLLLGGAAYAEGGVAEGMERGADAM